ncbi:hypothetical protein [Shewanella sp. GXUN23E]
MEFLTDPGIGECLIRAGLRFEVTEVDEWRIIEVAVTPISAA